MANITQGDGYYKTVVGWYGECSTTNGTLNECADLELKVYKQYISSAFQWDTVGTLKPWKSNLPDILNEKVFTKLECGNLYYLNIKPGTSSFTIPNFVISSYEASDSGRITNACELPDPTPTPVDCQCYPDGNVNIVIPNQDHLYMGHSFTNFITGSEVSYDETKFETALTSTVELNFPNGSNGGLIIFAGVQPKNNTFYVRYGNTCYSATATQSNVVSSGSWELTLDVVETLSSKCGDDKDLPTPTPAPHPTPTPVDCKCAPAHFTTIDSDGPDFANGHTHAGFDNAEISYDETTLSNALASTISLSYPNSSLAGIVALGGKAPNNTTFHVKYGNTCYSATATSSNGSDGDWDLTMSVSQNLSDGCGDDKDLPTPTPAPHPTPTPVDCKCAPAHFTTIDSDGPDFANGHTHAGFDNAEISYDETTLSNALASTISLSYPNSSLAGIVALGGKAPNNTTFHVKYGNTCYSATATSSNGSDGDWDLTMSVSQNLSDGCGDDKDLPTPTPAPDPTPTPTPATDSSSGCCPSETHSSFVTSGGGGLQVYEYTPPGANATTLLTWQGFDNGGKLCVDLTLTSGWSENSFESTKPVYLDSNPSLQVGTIRKLLKNGNEHGDIYYIDSNNMCHHAVYDDFEDRVVFQVSGVVETCCSPNDETTDIVNGSAITVNQISVNASANGEMDGNLCWERLEGFSAPSTYQVKFQGLGQEVQQILITATADVSQTKFRYEHKLGTCYEGFVLQNQISTFQEV